MAAVEDILLQSTNTTILLGTFAILFILYLFSPSFGPQRKEPPGPWPLPLLGNLLQLDPKSPHSTLYELYKKYGPVFTVHLGAKKVVMLAGHRTIKQALVNNDAFTDKENLPIINDLKLEHGIVFASGDSWKEMRQFALTNLKQSGMGKRENEERIIEESQYLIDVLRQKDGKAFDTTQPVSYAVSNIICSFVYGNRFDYDDQNFRSAVDQAKKNTQLMGSPSLHLYYNDNNGRSTSQGNRLLPRLKGSFSTMGRTPLGGLFRWLGARKQLMKGSFANRKKMTELIKGLQETLNPQMCRGFVDCFLVRKTQLEASGNMNSHYYEDNLLVSVVNLFTAGTDTTSSTLRYGLLLMAKYPEIQDQVQVELASVVGSRQVRVEDRKNLPYTDAVIHEIQRFANVTPVLVHCASRDVTFQGYFIKKGTPVAILLSSALQDEDEWEKAYTFNPGHFLDKEGNFRKRDAFLPFSTGSRSCVGEGLAKMELFLFFTSLLQHFCFTPPPGVTEDELDLTAVVGFALSPSPHELCAISRSDKD